jgi:hypothetical protein
MSSQFLPPGRVPTLTEVVQWSDGSAAPKAAGAPSALPARPPLATMPSPPRRAEGPMPIATQSAAPTAASLESPATATTAVSEDALIQQVYGDLQRQVELMLEYRLREALAPMLTRAADSIVRDARNELASTLRDVVARAVAQELSRHRPR